MQKMCVGDIPDIFDEDDEESEEEIDSGFEIAVEPDDEFDEEDLMELEKQLNKLQRFGEKYLVGKGKKKLLKTEECPIKENKKIGGKTGYSSFIKCICKD